MNRTNKILFVVFLILIVITLGEILYYFLNVQNQRTIDQAQPPSTSNLPANPSIQPNAEKAVLSSDVLNMLSVLNRNFLVSAELDVVFEGQVADIVLETNNESGTNNGDALFIVLTNTDENMATRLFKEYEPNTFYINKTTGGRSPFDFDNPEFKIGDIIRIKNVLDLTKDFSESVKTYEITIL